MRIEYHPNQLGPLTMREFGEGFALRYSIWRSGNGTGTGMFLLLFLIGAWRSGWHIILSLVRPGFESLFCHCLSNSYYKHIKSIGILRLRQNLKYIL